MITFHRKESESCGFYHSKERVSLHIFTYYSATWIDHIIIRLLSSKKEWSFCNCKIFRILHILQLQTSTLFSKIMDGLLCNQSVLLDIRWRYAVKGALWNGKNRKFLTVFYQKLSLIKDCRVTFETPCIDGNEYRNNKFMRSILSI